SAASLKQAWLRWRHLGAFGDLTFGVSTTPTWALVESYWGYRSLEKTVLDLQGLGFATDLGVALQRAPGAASPIGWHLMLSNDNGQKPENNASKKLSLSLPWRMRAFVLAALADWTGEPGARGRWTARLLGGWERGADAAGVEWFQRVNGGAGTGGADVRPAGACAWGRKSIGARWRAVGRVDWVDPDREQDAQGYRQFFFLAALDAMPRASVHLMPNLLVRTYQAKSASLPGRDADVS